MDKAIISFADAAEAIEDIRSRQRALFDLLLFIDQQGMALLNIYVTMCAAAIGAAAGAILLGARIAAIGAPALAATAACFLVAALYCVRTMASTGVGMVGRDAAFWKWALLEERVDAKAALAAYLDAAGASLDRNRAANNCAAKALTRAKLIGVAAPAAGVVAGGGAWLWTTLIG